MSWYPKIKFWILVVVPDPSLLVPTLEAFEICSDLKRGSEHPSSSSCAFQNDLLLKQAAKDFLIGQEVKQKIAKKGGSQIPHKLTKNVKNQKFV